MGKLLFVDDDIYMLKALKRSLRMYDFDCQYASNGFDAMEIVKKEEIDVVLTDMKMPEMDGLKLLKKLDEIQPDLVKIVVSGSTQMEQLIRTVNEVDVFKYISKPFDLHRELIPEILKALEYVEKRNKDSLKIDDLEKRNTSYREKLIRIESQVSNKESGYHVLKIYQQLFVQFLKHRQLKKEQLDWCCDLYQNFLDYFYDALESNVDYVDFTKITSYFESVHNVRLSIDKATMNQCYIEGIGCFVEPVLKTFVKDIRLYDQVGVIDIILSIEHIKDKKSILKMVFAMPNDTLLAYGRNPDQFLLMRRLIESFGGLVALENKELVIQMTLYKM